MLRDFKLMTRCHDPSDLKDLAYLVVFVFFAWDDWFLWKAAPEPYCIWAFADSSCISSMCISAMGFDTLVCISLLSAKPVDCI